MSWLDRLFGKEAPPPEAAAPSMGILFGLDPPDGCQFKVHCHRGTSWFVEIVKGHKELVSECVLIYGRDDDRELILEAADKALKSYERLVRRADLVGLYPPKRTQP